MFVNNFTCLQQQQPLAHIVQDGRDLSVDVIESCVLILELLYREFLTVITIDRLSEDEEVTARCVITALHILSVVMDKSDMVIPNAPPLVVHGL